MQRVNEDLREYAACGSKKGGAAEPVRTQGETKDIMKRR